MEDCFFQALLTNGVGFVNLVRNFSSPSVNSYIPVLDLLEEIGLFPLVFMVPHLCLPKLKIDRKNLLPLTLSKLKRQGCHAAERGRGRWLLGHP
jgi:hypothetical protein